MTITATDNADDTQLTQTFSLTLDATGVNDAPEIRDGQSDTQILGPLSAGGSASLNLNNVVIDEEGDDLTWSIESDASNSGLTINATTGLISGTVNAGAVDGLMRVEVHDDESASSP